MGPQFDVPPKHLLNAPMVPSTVPTCRGIPLGSAILVRNFGTDLGRQYGRQFTRVTRPGFPKARRTVVAEATQTADQFVSDGNIRTAELPETPPKAIRPVDSRKCGPRETRELSFIDVFQTDDRAKERHVIGFPGHKADLQRIAGHGHRNPPNAHFV